MAPTATAERVELTRLPVDRSMYDRLRALSLADGRSMSWHRREALNAYLDQQEASSR